MDDKEAGTMYMGEFRNNKKNGFGKLIFKATNDIYMGRFKDDYFHGVGNFSFSNGAVF